MVALKMGFANSTKYPLENLEVEVEFTALDMRRCRFSDLPERNGLAVIGTMWYICQALSGGTAALRIHSEGSVSLPDVKFNRI